jgi:hypothetical protein
MCVSQVIRSVIRTVAESTMNTEIPFTEDDIHRSSRVALAPAMVAMASFQGLRVVNWFIRCHVTPRLATLPRPDERQLALRALAMRMASSVAALAALDSVAQVNGIAAISRVVFELWLDVRALDREVYPDGPVKFWAHVKTERLAMARKAVAFDDAHPGALLNPPQVHRDFVGAEEAAIDAEALRLWGHNRPLHWSGTADIRQRAEAVGLEDRYIGLYPQLSTYSHGGAAGVEGLSIEAFHALAHLAHQIATDGVLDTVRILGQRCGLQGGIRDFDAKVDFLDRVAGLILVDLQLMSLGEPQRLRLGLGPCPDLDA